MSLRTTNIFGIFPVVSEILSENEIAPLGFPDNYNPKLGRKKRISTKNGIFVPEKKSRNFKINLWF